MTPETKPLPCPFCGKQPEVFQSGDGTGTMVECMTDGCVNPHVSYYGEGEAIRRWNLRPHSGRTPTGVSEQQIQNQAVCYICGAPSFCAVNVLVGAAGGATLMRPVCDAHNPYSVALSGMACRPGEAELIRSKLFQKFLEQGFWHAHHVDLVWRYNGEYVREEADWLKDLWYAIRGKPNV